MYDQPLLEQMDLWASHLFLTDYSFHEQFKDQLINCVYNNRKAAAEAVESTVAPTAKYSLYESAFDFFEHEDQSIKALKHYCENVVLLSAQEANHAFWPEDALVKVRITESWCHITQNGGYHDVHTHPNCSWCGIYYLDIGESGLSPRNGVNRFYDPRNNAEHYLDAGSLYLNAEGIFDIEPQDGQIIIFPSYLKHSALPYFGKNDRLVIAFNAQVVFE